MNMGTADNNESCTTFGSFRIEACQLLVYETAFGISQVHGRDYDPVFQFKIPYPARTEQSFHELLLCLIYNFIIRQAAAANHFPVRNIN